MKTTFEEFLNEKFTEEYNDRHDHDLAIVDADYVEDFYDTWLSNLNAEELIDYANAYGKIISKATNPF